MGLADSEGRTGVKRVYSNKTVETAASVRAKWEFFKKGQKNMHC